MAAAAGAPQRRKLRRERAGMSVSPWIGTLTIPHARVPRHASGALVVGELRRPPARPLLELVHLRCLERRERACDPRVLVDLERRLAADDRSAHALEGKRVAHGL